MDTSLPGGHWPGAVPKMIAATSPCCTATLAFCCPTILTPTLNSAPGDNLFQTSGNLIGSICCWPGCNHLVPETLTLLTDCISADEQVEASGWQGTEGLLPGRR